MQWSHLEQWNDLGILQSRHVRQYLMSTLLFLYEGSVIVLKYSSGRLKGSSVMCIFLGII